MAKSNNTPSPELVDLLNYVKNSRGLDFSGYKLTTLTRRFRKRMGEVEIDNYTNYKDYLEVHPEEFDHLFDTLLINVTSFVRDADAWEAIRNTVIPNIMENKTSKDPLRVWSVGCASGEEPYTASMILAEQLGVEAFCQRVKIYATDVDNHALSQARHAAYSAQALEPLSAEQRERFFIPAEQGFTFRRDMRRKIIFGRHDLVQDAPISKIDLLLCRNTLMYFNAETQSKILSRFRFALNDYGFIFLGKAEMLVSHSDAFEAVNLKHRIFRKLPTGRQSNDTFFSQSASAEGAQQISDHNQLREMAFDSSPVARLVINHEGQLILSNEQARRLFNLTSRDVGRPLRDLEVSYRPVELRSRIDEAIEQRHTVVLRSVRWHSVNSESLYLDVQVQPLFGSRSDIVGVSINFADVTGYKQLRQELENSKQELEVAYEELQSTNEELETTNEELQSSNEELETTNEELQSTNEELETMNEELQSTNEELQTVNDELHNSSEELNRSNAFLEAILASLDRGVVVVDRDLIIKAWNSQAEELWGLRSDEATGRHLLNLDIGLPLDELRQPLRECIAGQIDYVSEFVLNAVNRRGRRIECRITCTPLISRNNRAEGSEMQGVILLMEDHLLPGEE